MSFAAVEKRSAGSSLRCRDISPSRAHCPLRPSLHPTRAPFPPHAMLHPYAQKTVQNVPLAYVNRRANVYSANIKATRLEYVGVSRNHMRPDGRSLRWPPRSIKYYFFPKDIYLGELMSTVCGVHVGEWAGVGACSAAGNVMQDLEMFCNFG